MFVRNVGHLMTNPAILWGAESKEIPEGIMDAVVTTAIAIHDLKGHGANGIRNSRTGSVYIVKPKMHGPAEVAFANELFGRVEQLLGLPQNTVKLGIMDEERRTSVNLKACIAAAPARVAFINTGFLDRTGDEMHTAMHAGPMIRKGDMKTSAWLPAYEKQQRAGGPDHGPARPRPDRQGHVGHARPDEGHAGAKDRPPQSRCQHRLGALAHRRHAARAALPPGEGGRACRRSWKRPAPTPSAPTSWPTCCKCPWPKTPSGARPKSSKKLDNNVQGILGYVVRWVDQGVGCSKVPDIHDVGLMEDRATLRISSQHMANWLLHGIVTEAARCATPLTAWPPRWTSKTRATPLYQEHGRALCPIGAAYQAALRSGLQGRGAAHRLHRAPAARLAPEGQGRRLSHPQTIAAGA